METSGNVLDEGQPESDRKATSFASVAATRAEIRRNNPFARKTKKQDRYCQVQEKGLVTDAGEVTQLGEFVHHSFRSLVLNPVFVCAAARSALQKDNYRFSLYRQDLGTVEAATELAEDLYLFVQEQEIALKARGFSTFVASFCGPDSMDEDEFERRLWSQLQQLHTLDAPHHSWDSAVSGDSDNPYFAYSFAERGFFIVGLHPAASRWTRRFAWPTLVFNAHFQFEQLRENGKFQTMQRVIRDRDIELQGDINPNLTNFGERSDARQYSGRKVEEDWKCPFHRVSF